jgi:hypothetical protein
MPADTYTLIWDTGRNTLLTVKNPVIAPGTPYCGPETPHIWRVCGPGRLALWAATSTFSSPGRPYTENAEIPPLYMNIITGQKVSQYHRWVVCADVADNSRGLKTGTMSPLHTHLRGHCDGHTLVI